MGSWEGASNKKWLKHATILIEIFFFLRYPGLNPGAFYLRATPPALFFILYFETRSHEVVEASLRRERERERERERQGGRKRDLRLAANLDPPVSTSQTGPIFYTLF